MKYVIEKREKMNINVPEEAYIIIDTLEKHNYEAFIVGGCVRDSLLNKSPKDWDITTSALPEIVTSLFPKTIPTGIQHGTVTVIISGKSFEVTTYRIDGEYSDGRHPNGVCFTSSIMEDLSRRDFTINSMAYNSSIGLVDPFGGEADLTKGIIKCVGDAELRFREDALRMLRAIRFSCQLNFPIEPVTFTSICNNSSTIEKVSFERIRDEFCKILISQHPSQGIRLLHSSGILKIILPELEKCVGFSQKNPHHDKDVFEHILSVLDNSPCSIKLRLSALFHDIGKPECFIMDENGIGHFHGHDKVSASIAEKIMKRLKFDNSTIKDVSLLISEHMTGYAVLKVSSVKKLINRVGLDNVEELFQLQIADSKGHAVPDYTNILKIRTMARKIINEKQPLTVKDLAVKGTDLINIGYKPGISLGKELNKLLDLVLLYPEMNTIDNLLESAKLDL